MRGEEEGLNFPPREDRTRHQFVLSENMDNYMRESSRTYGEPTKCDNLSFAMIPILLPKTYYHVRASILPCQTSEIAIAVVVAGATISNFTDSSRVRCARSTQNGRREPRPADRPTAAAAARARARSGGNNNSFELKTNSDLGGHEGKRPANPLYQCRPSFLPKVRLNPTYLGAKSQI